MLYYISHSKDCYGAKVTPLISEKQPINISLSHCKVPKEDGVNSQNVLSNLHVKTVQTLLLGYHSDANVSPNDQSHIKPFNSF